MPTLPASLQPPPYRTPLFNTQGELVEEWRRFFLSVQTAILALLAFTGRIGSGQGMMGLEDAGSEDFGLVPGPKGDTGPAGTPGPWLGGGADGGDGGQDEMLLIPGPAGPTGPSGPQGPWLGGVPDMEGEDRESWLRPAFPLPVPVVQGGTGLTLGTDGGVLGYTAAGTLASSAALAATALVLGGGAGATPTTDSNWTINSASFLNSATQPRAGVYSTDQTIGNASFTTLTFASEVFDVGNMHSTVSNTSRLTVPANGAGLYLVIGLVSWTANGTGQRQMRLLLNGSVTFTHVLNNATASFVTLNQMSMLLGLVAGDYVELDCYQDSGGNLDVIGGTSRTIFQIVKLW